MENQDALTLAVKTVIDNYHAGAPNLQRLLGIIHHESAFREIDHEQLLEALRAKLGDFWPDPRDINTPKRRRDDRRK